MAYTDITTKLAFPVVKNVNYEILNSGGNRPLRRKVHPNNINTYRFSFVNLKLDEKNVIENIYPAPFTITLPNDGSVQLIFISDTLIIEQQSNSLFSVKFDAETFL